MFGFVEFDETARYKIIVKALEIISAIRYNNIKSIQLFWMS